MILFMGNWVGVRFETKGFIIKVENQILTKNCLM